MGSNPEVHISKGLNPRIRSGHLRHEARPADQLASSLTLTSHLDLTAFLLKQ